MKWDAWCSAKERKVPCSLIRSLFLSCKECLLGVMPAGQRVSAMSRSSAGIVAPVSACVYLKHGEGFAICFRNTVSKHLVLVIIKLYFETPLPSHEYLFWHELPIQKSLRHVHVLLELNYIFCTKFLLLMVKFEWIYKDGGWELIVSHFTKPGSTSLFRSGAAC